MQLHTQEHADLMSQFEQEYKGMRLEREPRDMWRRGVLYQDGLVNQLFLAYRRGYALAEAIESQK